MTRERKVAGMTAVDLFTDSLNILADGSVEVAAASSDSSPVDLGSGLVVVGDPAFRSVSAVRLTESSRHRGERHLDGDELVYLTAGSAGIELQREDSEERQTITLHPGEIAIVPRNVWHRVLVHEPSEFVFMVPGRTEVRVPQP